MEVGVRSGVLVVVVVGRVQGRAGQGGLRGGQPPESSLPESRRRPRHHRPHLPHLTVNPPPAQAPATPALLPPARSGLLCTPEIRMEEYIKSCKSQGRIG